MAVTQGITTPQVPPLGAPGNQTPASSVPGSTTTQDQASIGKTFDQFLTLLTTQLKNQDPLSPQDSTQFTSQLVQFSQVEQAINTNTKLDSLIASNQSNQLLQAASFIGKSVEVAGNTVKFDGTNPVSFGYTVNGDFTKGAITVTDADGNVVRNAPITLDPGHNMLTWDGTDTGGSKLPAGAYNITVVAVDKDNKPVDVAMSTVGKVTDVEMQNNQTVISVDGGKPMPLSSIMSVKS